MRNLNLLIQDNLRKQNDIISYFGYIKNKYHNDRTSEIKWYFKQLHRLKTKINHYNQIK